MAIRGYYLGCPGWGLKSWVGRLFPPGTKHTDFLARYAEEFNTVEGNTTFYALPTAADAQKPKLPVVVQATAQQPFVRCVPHEDFATSRVFVEEWVHHISRWIGEGKQQYFFMHAPDDTFAPENAYAFHGLLSSRVAVGELPMARSAPPARPFLSYDGLCFFHVGDVSLR